MIKNVLKNKIAIYCFSTKYLVVLLLMLFVNHRLISQPDSLVAYTSDFKFTEGVFTNFSNVLHNNPIPKGRILADVDYDSPDFFDKVLSKSNLFYVDNVGNKLSVETSKLWGYSRNGFLYVRIGDGYYRITLMGSCSHFVAYHTYEVQNTNTYPYSNSYQYPYSSYNPSVSTQTEMQQYILDFKTGRILEYDIEGIELVLMNDVELYDEYIQLSKKEQKQLKFIFIRKYNQRNPLYLFNTK
jgi:hypothetical protein